jgi:hypothetical protein
VLIPLIVNKVSEDRRIPTIPTEAGYAPTWRSPTPNMPATVPHPEIGQDGKDDAEPYTSTQN